MYHKIAVGSLGILVACSSESPFVGEYSCSATQTTTYTQPPNTTGSTGTTTQTVVIRDLDNGKLAAEVTTMGSIMPGCGSLIFSTRDTDAVLDSGQSCIVPTADGNFTLVLTSGNLHLQGEQLSGNFNGNISGTWLVNGTATPVVGRMVQSKSCSRF